MSIARRRGTAKPPRERNGETRERIPSERRRHRRRRIYLGGIQIYAKRHHHPAQPFPRTPAILKSSWRGTGAPFTSVLCPTVTDEPQRVRKIPRFRSIAGTQFAV